MCLVAPTGRHTVRLNIPPDSDVAPGTDYKGFVLLQSIDPRATKIAALESRNLRLEFPEKLILHTERELLTRQGIVLGIGLAFALREHPSAIPDAFKGTQAGEPVKIITSTLMKSEYDNRFYLAYFYIDEKGAVVTSFIAQRPWGSKCPSPTIPA